MDKILFQASSRWWCVRMSRCDAECDAKSRRSIGFLIISYLLSLTVPPKSPMNWP